MVVIPSHFSRRLSSLFTRNTNCLKHSFERRQRFQVCLTWRKVVHCCMVRIMLGRMCLLQAFQRFLISLLRVVMWVDSCTQAAPALSSSDAQHHVSMSAAANSLHVVNVTENKYGEKGTNALFTLIQTQEETHDCKIGGSKRKRKVTVQKECVGKPDTACGKHICFNTKKLSSARSGGHISIARGCGPRNFTSSLVERAAHWRFSSCFWFGVCVGVCLGKLWSRRHTWFVLLKKTTITSRQCPLSETTETIEEMSSGQRWTEQGFQDLAAKKRQRCLRFAHQQNKNQSVLEKARTEEDTEMLPARLEGGPIRLQRKCCPQ